MTKFTVTYDQFKSTIALIPTSPMIFWAFPDTFTCCGVVENYEFVLLYYAASKPNTFDADFPNAIQVSDVAVA